MRSVLSPTAVAILAFILIGPTWSRAADGPWPIEKAAAWGREHPWLVGCNYVAEHRDQPA